MLGGGLFSVYFLEIEILVFNKDVWAVPHFLTLTNLTPYNLTPYFLLP